MVDLAVGAGEALLTGTGGVAGAAGIAGLASASIEGFGTAGGTFELGAVVVAVATGTGLLGGVETVIAGRSNTGRLTAGTGLETVATG